MDDSKGRTTTLGIGTADERALDGAAMAAARMVRQGPEGREDKD